MYIFRANGNIDSEYIFSVLNSGLYNEYIEQFNVGYKLKLKHKMILDMKIPVFDTVTQQEIIQKHRKLAEENRRIRNLEKELKGRRDAYNKQLFQQIQNSINI